MAAVTATEVTEGHDAHADHGDAIYWKVFVVLFALTGLEVSTYWWPEGWHKVTHAILLVLMVIKFVTVAAYFMHLKGDKKLLQQVFVAGIILAVAVYTATLGAMVIFQDSGNTGFNDPPQEKPLPPPPTDPPPIIKEVQKHG